MNGVRSHISGCLDDPVHIQITVSGRALSNTDSLVCQLYMKAFGILFGIDSHTAYA